MLTWCFFLWLEPLLSLQVKRSIVQTPVKEVKMKKPGIRWLSLSSWACSGSQSPELGFFVWPQFLPLSLLPSTLTGLWAGLSINLKYSQGGWGAQGILKWLWWRQAGGWRQAFHSLNTHASHISIQSVVNAKYEQLAFTAHRTLTATPSIWCCHDLYFTDKETEA